MKLKILPCVAVLLLMACGQSYDEQKRLTRAQQRQLAREDSAALKVAVMPTLDCLPMYVAEHYQLLDTLNGGVRLKRFTAQMDCDTAMERGRVEGAISDLVRCERMQRRGTKLRYVAATETYWQLLTNRAARITQLSQLDDRMVAMTRYSATDLLTDRAVDSARLKYERVFHVQVNDVNIRLTMLLGNMMDAMLLTEPQATAARNAGHPVLMDSRQTGLRLGVLAFREKEMRRQKRHQQLDAFVKAYNAACDSINKYGVRHYKQLITKYCGVEAAVVDSLPTDLHFPTAAGPLQRDVLSVERWLKNKQ